MTGDTYHKYSHAHMPTHCMQLVDAVCAHLSHRQPTKPLILSVHGPPGVGKTFTHMLLARALYNKDPESASRCPGDDCQGYKVRQRKGHAVICF